MIESSASAKVVTGSDIISNKLVILTVESSATMEDILPSPPDITVLLTELVTTPHTSALPISTIVVVGAEAAPSINGFRVTHLILSYSSLSSYSSSLTTPTSFNTPSETLPFISSPSQTSKTASASTLSNSAKAGIGIGAFIGLIIMILPSILLWRSKRRNRNSKRKAASTPNDQFVKAELDADESQKPDHRARELPGDMAHELTGENTNGDDEVWELPGDMAHELRGGRDGIGVEIGELLGDTWL